MNSKVVPIRQGINIVGGTGRSEGLTQTHLGNILKITYEVRRAVSDAFVLYIQGGKDLRECFFPRTTECIHTVRTLILGLITGFVISGGIRSDTAEFTGYDLYKVLVQELEKQQLNPQNATK